MQLLDQDTGIIHDHDGIREASLFASCERGYTSGRKRPRFARIFNTTTTCLWCAVKADPKAHSYNNPWVPW